MKKQTRVIGFDDSPFTFEDETVLLVGVLMRLPNYIEGVVSTRVDVDGVDSTDAIAECISHKFHSQPEAIMVDGAAVGGFNIIDLEELWKTTGIPVISITRDPPDVTSMETALKKHFRDWEKRLGIVSKNRLFEVNTGHKPLHVSAWGLTEEEAKLLIGANIVRGAIPECLRIAHIIARGVSGNCGD